MFRQSTRKGSYRTMKVIDINKYIKTFSDKKTGTVTGYAIVGNITELIKEIEENNEVIEELENIKNKLQTESLENLRKNTRARADKKLMRFRTIQACERLIQ